jgi:hypothetical protein
MRFRSNSQVRNALDHHIADGEVALTEEQLGIAVNEPGSIYSLFPAPLFQVAIHPAAGGPGTHFMTQIGLLFRGGGLPVWGEHHD